MMRTDLEDDIVGAESTSVKNGDSDGARQADAYVQWLLISGLVCFGFAAVASFVILLRLWLMGYAEEGLVFRLLVKGVFFTLMLGICALLAHRSREKVKPVPHKSILRESTPRWLYAVVGILLLAVVYPMLHEYPWTAPDELHHLVVVRNISEYSAYASGNPTAGFTYFDHVDSVGPSVLGPIALAFKTFSPTITAARMVMGTFFLGLAFGIFVLVQDFWGRREAVLSVAITTLSFGTIYLARSLYGEVPSLMFLVWSMVCWERSFHSDRGNALAVASGVLWGLGILAKSFLFLFAFPIIGVWLYDRLTTKQISAKQILLPGVGGLAVLGTWYVTTAYYSYLVTEEISMVFLYRHYLMFGLSSSWNGFEWFANQPVCSASLLVIVLYAIPQLFERIQNPALRVLLLSSDLYLFWWIFYTPASIFRYMWYSCAIVGIFSGPMILRGYRAVRDSASPPRQRIVFLLAGVSVLIPCGYRLVEQIGLIYMQDEAADECDLAENLRSLPEDVLIASAYWPIGMGMDFMAQRNIHGIADLSDIDDKYDVIIYNVDFDPVNAETLEGAHRIGRYAVIRTDRTKGTTYFDRQRN